MKYDYKYFKKLDSKKSDTEIDYEQLSEDEEERLEESGLKSYKANLELKWLFCRRSKKYHPKA